MNWKCLDKEYFIFFIYIEYYKNVFLWFNEYKVYLMFVSDLVNIKVVVWDENNIILLF